MISVIMPLWNGAKYMDRAIASVVAQTRPEWELLIVDDGSIDDSVPRAERWRDLVNLHFGEEKIRLFSTGRPNSGPAVGRNLAAGNARYDIFGYLDHDDLYFPRRIESLLFFLTQYDCGVVFSPYEILEKGRLTLWNVQGQWEQQSYVCSSEGEREPPFGVWIKSELQRCNISVPLGVAHRAKIFEQVGGFQPEIFVGSDGVLWRRMADQGATIGFCPVIAGRYYVRPDSQARTRRPFSTGGFELDKNHPVGANGQYLDAGWFANLKKKKASSGE